RLPVQQVPRGGHHPGAGDALDRRGDGDRRDVPDGVRQEPDGGQQRPAALRDDLPLGGGPRQGRGGGGGAVAGATGLPAGLNARHGAGAGAGGHRGGGDPEDPGGAAEPDRLHEEPAGGTGDQHAERPRGADGRGEDPRRGGGARGDVHHHAGGGPGGGRGVRRTPPGRADRD